MNEELQFIIDSAIESMGSAVEHLENELLKIRAGKANPVMLSSVMVGLLWITNSLKPSCKCKHTRCTNIIYSALGKSITC